MNRRDHGVVGRVDDRDGFALDQGQPGAVGTDRRIRIGGDSGNDVVPGAEFFRVYDGAVGDVNDRQGVGDRVGCVGRRIGLDNRGVPGR